MKNFPEEQPKPYEGEGSNLPAPSSTFHLILYNPGEASLHGKIKFPLDKEERSFQGLDLEVIRRFLEEKIPRNSEQGGSINLVAPILKTTPIAKNSFELAFGRTHEQSMDHIHFLLDFRKINLDAYMGRKVKLSLWIRKAQSQENKRRLFWELVPIEPKETTWEVPCKGLDTGTYLFTLRLEYLGDSKSDRFCLEANKFLAFVADS
ncbi:MAG: hypothetical protein AAF694_21860 [Bacteroidota bacterium]